MINRTFRFYGQAFSVSGSVSVVAKFNGQQIYSGPVPTIDRPEPQQPGNQDIVMFEYTGPIDIHGLVPFELKVTGGIVCFGWIDANYSGVKFNLNRTDPDNHILVINIAPEDFWSDVNENNIETDGKINVEINGIAQSRQLLDSTQLGDWWYQILDSQTFTCDIVVDPDLIISRVPTLEEANEIKDALRALDPDGIPRERTGLSTTEEKNILKSAYSILRS
jgi:hypothetical protein